MDTNVVALSGRFVADPEIKTTQSNKTVASFNLAISEGYGDKKKTLFVSVEAWQKTAEALQRFGAKGNRVAVEGRVSVDEWTDKDTGKKRSRVKFVASNVNFIDFPQQDDSQADGYAPPTSHSQVVEDDDIPF